MPRDAAVVILQALFTGIVGDHMVMFQGDLIYLPCGIGDRLTANCVASEKTKNKKEKTFAGLLQYMPPIEDEASKVY